MAKKKKASGSGDYATAVTTEEKLAEIAAAGKASELDAMWSAWEEHGWSKDGVLYGEILQRKQELGAKLSGQDIQRAEIAAKRKGGA